MPCRTLAVVCALLALAAPTSALAQMAIDSLDGPVTQHEIDTYKAFVAMQTPPVNNYGNALAHHGPGQTIDSIALMYQITRDPAILDLCVQWADAALAGRNDPNTGLIAWTGNRELFWPIGANADGTAAPSTNGEQGEVMSHIAFCARVILEDPSVWDRPVTAGDPRGFGVTYKQRAMTYVKECDRTEDTFILKWYLDPEDRWRFPTDMRFNGSTWYGGGFPWNQQSMLSGAIMNLAAGHVVLGDDPARVHHYDAIVQAYFDWWLSLDLSNNQVTFGGMPAYLWHYGADVPTPIEDTGHGAYDLWGAWRVWHADRYTVSDMVMQRLANTVRYGIVMGNLFSLRIDGTNGTQTTLESEYVFMSEWNSDLYKIIAQADLQAAKTNAMLDASILWVKNAWMNGWGGGGSGMGDAGLEIDSGSSGSGGGNGGTADASLEIDGAASSGTGTGVGPTGSSSGTSVSGGSSGPSNAAGGTPGGGSTVAQGCTCSSSGHRTSRSERLIGAGIVMAWLGAVTRRTARRKRRH
jgi:hypothetical protein